MDIAGTMCGIEALGDLMLFLAKDCCGGRAELCKPLVTELSDCC